MVAEIIGFLGSLCSVVLWMPQALVTWRNRKKPEYLKGLSKLSLLFVISNALLWLVYSIMIKSIPVGIPSVINLPLSCMMLYLCIKSSSHTPTKGIVS